MKPIVNMNALQQANVRIPDQTLRLLSVSERSAVEAVLPHLTEPEKTVVIAGLGVPRSAACQAIRLLEAAGILSARSLGPKGLRIRILANPDDGPAERLLRIMTVSERIAAGAILAVVDPKQETTVITASIAARCGIYQSAACQAMRLLEAAGIVRTRSRGPKGLLVHVVDRAAFVALKDALTAAN